MAKKKKGKMATKRILIVKMDSGGKRREWRVEIKGREDYFPFCTD